MAETTITSASRRRSVGDTAVARYDWSMAWIQDGKADRASGQELLVFQRRGSHWVAIESVMLY